jgi:hypothetical protein
MSTAKLIFPGAIAVLVLLVCESAGAQALANPVLAAGPRPVQTIVLKEGTQVNLKFAQKLTSKGAVVDQPVELVLSEDLKVLDYMVVKSGARVLGTVVAGKESESKRVGARDLAIRVDFLHSGNNRIALRGDKFAEGKRNKDAMVARTILLGIGGLMAASGKHYVIPEGTPLTAYVDRNIELPVLQN